MSNKRTNDPRSPRRGSYRLYAFFLAGFVTVLVCSNLIAPSKVCEIAVPSWLAWTGLSVFTFGAGNLFFPIAYIFGDVLTEVYGYALARRVIWAGFAGLLFASIMSAVIVALPASPNEPFNEKLQPAVQLIFGSTWRISIASLIAFWCGDFVNSYVLARMKVWTGGRMLWTRTIGSTIVGQAVDSLAFYPIAFGGVWAGTTMVHVILFNWIFKVSVEVLFTPITYAVVAWMKRVEKEDYYDQDTNFTPFSLAE